MNVFNIGWVVNIWIIIRNFLKILFRAKNSLPHIKLVFKPTWTTKASNWGIILSIEKTPKFPPHFFNQKFRSWNFLVLFLYFSVIRLILWKKFVKKIWKPPKQKLTKTLRDEVWNFRKNFGTEFTFIRSHYQNFNTGRYSIWRKVILSNNFYGL